MSLVPFGSLVSFVHFMVKTSFREPALFAVISRAVLSLAEGGGELDQGPLDEVER